MAAAEVVDDELKPVAPHALAAAVPIVVKPLPLLSDADDTIRLLLEAE